MTGRRWTALAGPVVLGAVLGGLGGWLWWVWWGPATQGRIYETQAGKAWYPDPFDPGITRDFSGTATYVVLGFALALLLGLLGGWIARQHALLGVVAVVLGAALGALAMTLVGESLSPPDPNSLLSSHAVGDRLPGSLAVAGWTPYLAWPVGALLGYLVLMVSLPVPPSPESASAGSEQSAPRSGAPAPQG